MCKYAITKIAIQTITIPHGPRVSRIAQWAIGLKGVVLRRSPITAPHYPRCQSGSHFHWDVRVAITCTGINYRSLHTRPITFVVLLLLIFLLKASFFPCLERWWPKGFTALEALASIGSPEPKSFGEALDGAPLCIIYGLRYSPNSTPSCTSPKM